jgi:hypothetical protein
VSAYDAAVSELYQTPLASFVIERKRLAGELKASGDADGAKRFAKLPRPTMSAWVVNQLYWHARDAFDAMLKTADTLRSGDLGATGKHREAIAALRERAAAMLDHAGHAANEATLRRVTQTLAAIAANGGFDPDAPGTLAADRDPPGFEAIGIVGAPLESRAPAKQPHHEAKQPQHEPHDELKDARAAAAAKAKQREHAEAAQRAADLAEKRREETERARLKAERHRLEAALRTARGEVEAREQAIKALRKQLHEAEKAIEHARSIASDLERKLDD